MRVLKERFGLLILLIILAIITVASIKPGFYLMGWDNYSSYFNLKTNLFRTLFATWREYRGIGVASDSEVVDIFRQVFFLVFSFVVPEQMLDQLYFLFSLWAGVLGMYVLFRSLIVRYTGKYNNGNLIDLGSAVSAGLYLFNLNTLATFYFPIIPYITRFGSLPWIFWAWIELVRQPVWTARFILLCLGIFLITTGSYLTATIFLTTTATLIFVSLFQGSLKRVSLAILLFLSINSFWLLPFANYAKEKGPSIRLAPVFVDTNELQLNQSKEAYSLKNTFLLMPNFFTTTFTDMNTRGTHRFHELATLRNRPEYQAMLSFFPLLALIGVFVVVGKSLWDKRMRRALWIPCLLLLYWMMSMKEYSPLGRVYQLLTAIPYFSVLFRFGDTKFHPYLAFVGSISAGVGISWMMVRMKRWVSALVLIGIAIPTFFVFRWYFQGNLIGFFMYNRLPDAYRQIASVVNKDPSYGRVLHLPFDKNAYWKSYSWGPIGSSFFNFFLDKPFLDKTFEPASLEQSSLFEELATTLEDVSTISDKDRLDVRADRLYRLLTDVAVRYVIVDHTVTPEVVSRGIRYWGAFNLFDSIALTDRLKERGFLELIGTYPVDLAAIGTYPGSFGPGGSEIQSIQLFRVLPDANTASFLEDATLIDGKLDRQSRTIRSILGFQEPYMENNQEPSVIYPFLRRDGNIENFGSRLSLTLPVGQRQKGTYRLTSAGEATSTIVDVSAFQTSRATVFRLYQVDAPSISGQRLKRLIKEISVPLTAMSKKDGIQTPSGEYVANWHILDGNPIGSMRLAVGDVVLPVPTTVDAVEKSLGTVLVRGPRVPFVLLTRSNRRLLAPDAFAFTNDANCFGDKLPGFSSQRSQTGGLTIRSVNGSTCLMVALGAAEGHKEIGLEIEGEVQDLDPDEARFVQRVAGAFSKPNTLVVCIKTGTTDSCANTHQVIRVPTQRSLLVVPSERTIGAASSLSFLLALKNIGYQRQSLTIYQAFVDEFRPVLQDTFTLAPPSQNFDVTLDNTGAIQIDIPKVLSPFSYFYNPKSDAFLVSNRPCENAPSGYRTSRVTTEGKWLGMISNCTNDVLQTLPFSGNNLYLWDVSYRLFSGEFPKFILRDSFAHYRDEYLSLYQRYPDITGFGVLQHADSPGLARSVQETAGIITGSPATHATTYIYPKPELGDGRDKAFTLTQHAGNHGMWALDGFTVVALPEHWAGLSLTPREGSRKSYPAPPVYTVKSLLPSLWHVEVTDAAASGLSLLEFRQGFDRQWGIYDSLWGVLVGKSLAPSVRCQGYANCFTLSGSELKRDLYLFYTPERLSLLGWLGTAAVVVTILIVLRSRRTRSS